MAEKDFTEEQSEVAGDVTADTATGVEEIDPYDAELRRFEATLDSDQNEALDRYGLTLFHSLPPLKQVELGQKLGFPCDSALDHYNLGCLAASNDDMKAALAQFKKAVALDETYTDALYNLALTQEKLGHKAEAVELWKRFMEGADSEEDKELVKAHLAELSA